VSEPSSPAAAGAAWPDLPLASWADTHATLHRWLQIVGKVRLALSPPQNHCWNATLYVTATGLTTSPVPHPAGSFMVDFDFCAQRLVIRTTEGADGGFALAPMSVATFHRRTMDELVRLRRPVRIHPRPNEVADPIPFAEDEVHHAYDAERATRFWRILVEVDRVLKVFRARFIGKSSPVHLFWGAPDLAATRFSGRRAPRHPGGIPGLPDVVTRDAYSHEVSSAGFWAGGGPVADPAFYSYAYPEPPRFATSAVPSPAYYNAELREFVLPYDAVRTSDAPDATLLSFLEATYVAAADNGGWDRASLERAATGAQ
jgi:hypothetical protein